MGWFDPQNTEGPSLGNIGLMDVLGLALGKEGYLNQAINYGRMKQNANAISTLLEGSPQSGGDVLGSNAQPDGQAALPSPDLATRVGKPTGAASAFGSLPAAQQQIIRTMLNVGDVKGALDAVSSLTTPKLDTDQVLGPNGVTLAPGAADARRNAAMSDQMGKDYFLPDGQGGIKRVSGYDPSVQATQYATEFGKSQGGLPAQLAQTQEQGNQSRQTDLLRASTTPLTIEVPDPQNPGMTKTIITNAAAVRNGSIDGITKPDAVTSALMPSLVKGVADRQDEAHSATQALADLGELRKALNGLPTGPGTEILNDSAAALQKLGINANDLLPEGAATDPSQFQIAAKNINQLGMALARANFPGGRITNADLNMAIKATPNFGNNPDANKVLLDNIEALQRLKIERAQFDQRYLFNHGNMPSLGMEKEWSDKVGGMSGVPDNIRQAYMSYSDQAANPGAPKAPQIDLPAALSDGSVPVQYRIKNGKTEYQWKRPDGTLFSGDAKGQ